MIVRTATVFRFSGTWKEEFDTQSGANVRAGFVKNTD